MILYIQITSWKLRFIYMHPFFLTKRWDLMCGAKYRSSLCRRKVQKLTRVHTYTHLLNWGKKGYFRLFSYFKLLLMCLFYWEKFWTNNTHHPRLEYQRAEKVLPKLITYSTNQTFIGSGHLVNTNTRWLEPLSCNRLDGPLLCLKITFFKADDYFKGQINTD